jgi:dihydroorotate dehydrogenase (fumarate)
MVQLKIEPPLLNSASPWATTFEDIKELYESPYTGAVTTRTSLLEGFSHDEEVHQRCFFEAGKNARGKGDASAWNGR